MGDRLAEEIQQIEDLVAQNNKQTGVLGGLRRLHAEIIGRFVGQQPKMLLIAGGAEQGIATVLALAVGLTVALAGFYGSVSWSLIRTGRVETTPSSIRAGILLAVAIYIVERILLKMMTTDFDFGHAKTSGALSGYQDSTPRITIWTRLLRVATTRFAIALLIASIVSDPLLLIVYEDDIEQVLQTRRDIELQQVIDEIEQRAEPQIEDEKPEPNENIVDLRNQIDGLEGEITSNETAAKAADKRQEQQQQLANCEQEGSQSPACTALQGDGDPNLSGAETCDRLCQGYLTQAAKEGETATEARERIEQIKKDELPQAKRALELAEEGLVSSLSVDLGGGFTSATPNTARKECEIAAAQMLYRTLATDDPRSNALFTYCNEQGSTYDTEEIEQAKAPYTGLYPRQDAFNVLEECSDPLGMRSSEPNPEEPVFCSQLTNPTEGLPDTEIPGTNLNTIERLLRTMSDLFDIPNSTLGQNAAKLRWLIVAIDTLPIFLKFSLSARRRRPYDALTTYEKSYRLATVNEALKKIETHTQPDPKDRYWRTMLGSGRTLNLFPANLFGKENQTDEKQQPESSGDDRIQRNLDKINYDDSTDPFSPTPETSPENESTTNPENDQPTSAQDIPKI